MPEKHYIITTKTDAAAAAVEQLLAELQDSIDVQETVEIDAQTLKSIEQGMREAESGVRGKDWGTVYKSIKAKYDL